MSDLRAAPYPPETRSKGWRFELDLERMRQSDTWALASPDIRPWLLMLWSESWCQVPCGSMPNDDTLIAARIGMAPKAFTKARAVLLRGWWAADDGRLYHPVITEFVAGMLKRKEAERQRKAEYRTRMDAERRHPSADVPRDSCGTDGGRTPDSGGRDATGTGTGTGTGLEDSGADAPTSSAPGFAPTPAAAVCIALKAAGIANVNPSNQTLRTLVEAGADVAEFVAHVKATEGKHDRFAYLLGIVEGQRKRAAATAGAIHHGPLRVVGKQAALEERNASVAASWAAKRGTVDAT